MDSRLFEPEHKKITSFLIKYPEIKYEDIEAEIKKETTVLSDELFPLARKWRQFDSLLTTVLYSWLAQIVLCVAVMLLISMQKGRHFFGTVWSWTFLGIGGGLLLTALVLIICRGVYLSKITSLIESYSDYDYQTERDILRLAGIMTEGKYEGWNTTWEPINQFIYQSYGYLDSIASMYLKTLEYLSKLKSLEASKDYEVTFAGYTDNDDIVFNVYTKDDYLFCNIHIWMPKIRENLKEKEGNYILDFTGLDEVWKDYDFGQDSEQTEKLEETKE